MINLGQINAIMKYDLHCSHPLLALAYFGQEIDELWGRWYSCLLPPDLNHIMRNAS